MRTGRLVRIVLVLAAAVLVLGACHGGDPWPADLEVVDHPALDGVEDVARRQLEEQRARLAKIVARGRGERRELADAFGGMGELYHAYRLLPAAIVCYSNARRLDPDSLPWVYDLGLARTESGDLEAAVESFERALELRPDHLPAHLRLGDAYLGLGNLPAAEPHFRAGLDDEASSAAAHYGLGRVAAARGDHVTAVEHFERVLEIRPGAGGVIYALGQALRQVGRIDEAEEVLARRAPGPSASAHPNAGSPDAGEMTFPDPLRERLESLAVSSGALLRRGNRALMQGRFEVAEKAFHRALEIRPENLEAHRNLAQAQLRRGDPEAAIRSLRVALEHHLDNADLHFDLGNAYSVQGLRQSAIAELRRAVELRDDLVAAHFNLANQLVALDRWDEAAPELDKVVIRRPDDTRARYLQAMASQKLGKPEEAISRLAALVAEDPSHTPARRGLASIYAEQKAWPRAAAALHAGLALDLPVPDKVGLAGDLARVAWKQGREDEAVGWYRKAVELDPTSSEAVTQLANALQLTGQHPEAVDLFGRARELDPENATAWLSEARLLILAGGFAIARDRLETALGFLPDDAPLTDTLARLLATCSDDTVRDGRRAVVLAQRAYSLDRRLEHAETLGMAFAETGDFERARRWQQSLVNQAAVAGRKDLVPRFLQSLRMFERRQPVRIDRRAE